MDRALVLLGRAGDAPDAALEELLAVDVEALRAEIPQTEEHLAKFERQYLSDLLARHHGDVKAAALEARLPRGTLYRLLKNNKLDGGKFR